MPNPTKTRASKPSGASSGTPLRFPRKNARKAPNVVESKSGEPQPKAPTLAFLSGRVDALYGIIAELEAEIETRDLKHADLVKEVRDLRLSFSTKLDRVVRAVQARHARNPP